MFRKICPLGLQLLWNHPARLSTCKDWSRILGCRETHLSATWRQQAEFMDTMSKPRPKAPFSRSEMALFCQEPARIGNPYLEDAFLQGYLESRLPPQVFAEVSADLERFGTRLKDEIDSLGQECESNPPRVQHFDAWGQRVDHLITCSAWKRMKVISAEEGLVAEAYERRHSSWSRVHQIAKIYMYAPSAGYFVCPLAMTDGAAKVIETLGVPGPLEESYTRLTSRDPKRFWTSGQWMTERKGGSDVANGTETVALKLPDDTYSLHGLKWFTSAVDSDMTLTLARIMDGKGKVEQGSKGLSLFYLEVRDEDGKLNGMEIQRLKEKLGTRQLPTAELLLDGAKAHLISAEGRGVSCIANMLTIARLYNAIGAVGCMRRMVFLARDYATRREAFGKYLKEHPLHMQTLARMEVQVRGAFLLVMEISRLLGLEETNMATTEDQHVLRLLTPIVKLYTGKQAVAVISEGLECFGGQGYMEDTGLASMLRDAQVLTIWEGTTNILALDVLRSLVKSQGKVMEAFFSTAQTKLESASRLSELEDPVARVQEALHKLKRFMQKISSKGEATMQLAARDFAYTLARIYAGALLLEHAARPRASATDITSAQRWCHQDLCPVDREDQAGSYETEAPPLDTTLVYGANPVLKGKL